MIMTVVTKKSRDNKIMEDVATVDDGDGSTESHSDKGSRNDLIVISCGGYGRLVLRAYRFS